MHEGTPNTASQGELSVSQLTDILKNCYEGMSERILPSEEATMRAQMIFDDMAKVRFPLVFGQLWPVAFPGFQTIEVPSYRLEDTKYGPHADPEGNHGRDAAGPMISCGEFIRLSRACKLGRELLAKRWPQIFTSRLQDADDHLTVIDELLWLGRWHNPQYIKNSFRQNPATGKDVDWRFRCCDQIINLEVKYRRRDWMGVTDGPSFSRNFDSYFEDIEGKFGPQQKGELNIVGITTFCPPDATLGKCVARFLDRTPEVDGIIFWSLSDPEGKRPEVFGRHKDLIQLFLKKDDTEEDKIVAPIRHLWRNRDERRTMRADEAITALNKLFSI